MKVLVTGATGYLGGFLMPALLEREHSVTAVVRAAERLPELPAGVPGRVADLSAVVDWTALVDGVDAVVHAAAAVRGVTTAVKHRVNCEATGALAQAAAAAGVSRFVYVSTNLVYGPQPAWPCSEETPPAAVGDYATTKLDGERAVQAVAASTWPGPFRAAIVRLGHVYGRDGDRLRQGIERRLLDTPDSSLVHWIHIDDVIAGLVLVLESEADGVFNLGDDRPLSVAEAAGLLGLALPERKELRLPEPILAMDTRRAGTLLGFRPRYPDLAAAIVAGIA